MGVKSSYDVTRGYALMIIEQAIAQPPLHGTLSNETLAYIIELINDDQHGGEGYENYRIVPDGEEDEFIGRAK